MRIDQVLHEVSEELEQAERIALDAANKVEAAKSAVGTAVVGSAAAAINGAAEAAVKLEEIEDRLLEGQAGKKS